MEKNINNSRLLILSDLDGTLLNNKSKLDPLTIKTVKEISKMGHIFCIVTGRPARASIGFYKQLGLKHLMVNYNGSSIINPTSKDFLPINLGFSFDVAKSILTNKLMSKWIEDYVVENNTGTYISSIPKNKANRKSLFENFHIRDEKHVSLIKPDLSNISKSDVNSIILRLKNKKYLDDVLYQIRWLSGTLITRTWKFQNLGIIIEINSMFSTKGRALKFLSSYYGIPLTNCVSFGDADNDTDMLQSARFGFAMKNATIAAKLYSHYITKYDNNNSGVARELIDLIKMNEIFDKQQALMNIKLDAPLKPKKWRLFRGKKIYE